jgi:hypothetical protein
LSTVLAAFPRFIILEAAVEQRRHEDAKAETKAMLAISPKPENFTWQVNPNPPPEPPASEGRPPRAISERHQSALKAT